jgi:transcriptional regulator with XRE-family HTH domain
MRDQTAIPTPASQRPLESIEVRITQTGDALLRGLTRVIDQLPGAEAGPQKLAGQLGVDKVLASRLLKALRSTDPMAMVHRTPGPEPLRRVLAASAKLGVSPDLLAEAHAAVNQYEDLIRSDIGDRSALEAILSAWVPEARREFELRRKQAAYRAMSQLKGVEAQVYAEAAIFWPSADGQHIDIVWIKAVIGLHRLRPGAPVHFTSQRRVEGRDGRRPTNLAGEPVDSVQGAVVPEFSTNPVPRLRTQIVGEATHYLLDEPGFGSGSAVNLVTCEVNRAEIPRYLPVSRNRRAWASSDINIPAHTSQFDLLIHQDLYPGENPDLRVYDTTIRGQADINDRTRDIDQFDLLENVEPLGTHTDRFGSSVVPQYRGLLSHIVSSLGFDGSKLRGYRVLSEYPIYGSQFAMTLRTTDPPATP